MTVWVNRYSWYLYEMVAQNMLRTFDVEYDFFREKKIGFDNSFDVTRCIQQIEIPDLPSNISTMFDSKSFRPPKTYPLEGPWGRIML